ncbi:hypothetical protein BCR32DRAFT_287863 [Anaeromyces robustus]|uniref:Uncharacterized protein n=1 Tax=Anaeromyces robustus TaxID=1754192 RepID=A0A1Y1VPV3_9FUNG|nr:hypothetical protein BCR32DRAFT_287863 [Anaeromyces robustus]|eukprot:ORX63307.1 hypothetical protein BCR32DRAFT_287863 [Anaeromyces robustus]
MTNFKKWKGLFKCQTKSDTYSKSSFLLRFAALLNNIMVVVCKRQHIYCSINSKPTNFSHKEC